MAAPTLVAFGSPAAGTGDVTPGLPTGWAEGDIFLLFVESNSSQPLSSLSGWTADARSPQDIGGLGSTCLSLFYRRATSSESAPTVPDTGNHTYAVIGAFRGCIETGNPIDAGAGNTQSPASTSVAIPGATTSVADCLVVAAVAHGLDVTTAQLSSWANGDLASIAEIFDGATDQGGGGGLGIAAGVKTAAGAYGSTTATLASSSEQGRISVALKPAAGGSPVELAAAIASGAGVAAALTVGKPLASTIASRAGVAGALAVGKPLAATVASRAGVAGVLAVGKPLAATVASGAGVVASLSVGAVVATARRVRLLLGAGQ